jgi:Rrf2 family transcriptional regulator, iron-sulfur cluster assembly transcription factor
MLLSKSCVYGLRASLYLAARDDNGFVPIREMSDKLEISFHFLTKILQQLTGEGMLESYKGPNGGVRLTRPGDDISLMEVVMAIDGDYMLTECALGLPGCGVMKPCPIHEKWAETRDGIRNMLESTTLTELTKKGKDLDLRITAEGGFRDLL